MPAHKPILGVVHLAPLLPLRNAMAAVLARALADAQALQRGGVTGIMVENFGDAPFHKGTHDDPVPPHVPAALAVVAREIARVTHLPTGINCLRNDGRAALAAAAVAGARWVRVNVLTGAYVTDQGLIEGEAAGISSYRRSLGHAVTLLADLLVKHATPLAVMDPVTAALDLAQRSGADGLILTGARTGSAVDQDYLRRIKSAVGRFPVWLGSGLDLDNAADLWPYCDGAIVGTAFKCGGDVRAAVDPARVTRLCRLLQKLTVPAAQGRAGQRSKSRS